MGDQRLTKLEGTTKASSDIAIKVIKKWLALFATVARQKVEPDLLDVWIELLGQYDPRLLNAACERVAKTWSIANTIPPPGEIASRVQDDFAQLRKVDALDEWMTARKLIEAHYYSDLGYRGPAMTAIMRRAVASAGGMHMIANCAESELPWCQKRFVEYYESALRSEEIENSYGLVDPDIKRLMADFAETKRLQ